MATSSLVDTRNSLLRSDGGPRIATVGLEGIAVIASADAVFVSPLARAAEVKDIVNSLDPESGGRPPEKKGMHPCGMLETLSETAFFDVQRALVHEGRTLRSVAAKSMQLIVIRGSGKLDAGGSQSSLQAQTATTIDPGTSFEISNSGSALLELLLVQIGTAVVRALSNSKAS